MTRSAAYWIRCCVAVLVACLLVGGVLLAPGGARAQAGGTAMFTDVAGHWAEKYITQVRLKEVAWGYGDGRFGPEEQVTRLECITLLVRVLGLDAQARATTAIPASFARPDLVPEWGRGYVAVAVQRDLLTASDLLDFRAVERATRLDVAAWAVRALGLGEEAAQSQPSLAYSDALLIPSWGRGYVAVAAREGIMTGLPDGRFDPDGTVTRATMAAICARLDDRLSNSLDVIEVRGRLAAAGTGVTPTITLTLADGTARTLPVAPDCAVYRDSLRITLGGLFPGEELRVILDRTGRAALIDNAPPAPQTTVTGTLVAVVSGPSPVLTFRDEEGESKALTVAEACRITREGRQSTLADLRAGDALELVVRGTTVVQIKATVQDFEVEGVFVRVSYGTTPTVVVKTEGVERSYPLDLDAVVKRNGQTSSLASLRAGDEVVLAVRGGLVTRITAEVTEESLTGTVTRVTIGAVPEITIRTDAAEEKTYEVSPTAVIRKGRTRIELNQVRPGWFVEVKVESGEVTRMDVEPYTVLEDVKGVVDYVVESADVLVISPLGGETLASREIHVTAGTLFVRGDDLIDFDDLEPGDRVIAVGSRATGIFVARVVMVLTVRE